MMTQTRKELLATLANISAACPEMRFGQLIANLSTLAKGLSAEGLWDVEDDDLLNAAHEQMSYFAEHRPNVDATAGDKVVIPTQASAVV
jgi:hypothetical protein